MFNISIQQDVLMTALKYLEPTVGKNVGGFGDNCVSMKTNGIGAMEMYTTNTIEFTKLNAIVSFGGNTVEQAPYVDFKRFKTIIGSIPSNEIVTIEATVNDLMINFALKKVPIQLVGCVNGMIPLPTNVFPSSNAITVPKKYIKTAADNVCAIIEDSVSSPIYNCMRIATTGNNVEVSAVDINGKRTFVQAFSATNNNPTVDALIEASKIKKSMGIFEDFNELEFSMDPSMVMVSGTDPVSQMSQKANGMVSDISYYCRRLTGAFPTNIAANFTPYPKEYIEIKKQEIESSITRVKAIEDKTSSGVIGFEIAGNLVNITCNSVYGNIEDSITAENTATQSFKTVFKYDHLNDIIKILGTDTFEIGVLPNHPSNYLIRAKGSNDILFAIPAMTGATGTKTTP